MSLSQSAATGFVPLLARLALAAVFIPAGYNKLMKEAEFSGDDAKRLRELSVIASAASDAHARTRTVSNPREPAAPLALSFALVPDPAAQNEGQAPSTPPSKPTTDESPSATPPTKPGDTSIAQAPASGEPVKARALHRLTIMVDKAGWPYQTSLAWLAAVTEFVGGICLVLGLFSRVWAFGLAVTMGVAFYLTSLEPVMSTMVIDLPIDAFTRYSSQVALFALAFGLTFSGSGSLAIDRRLVGGGGGGGGKKAGADE